LDEDIEYHWDGGLNSNLFIKHEPFYVLQPIKSQITQVSRSTARCERIGIVLVKIPKSDIIIPLYPVYYAPTFPQNTVSPNAIKHYNKFRSVRSEALDWIRMVTHVGQKIHIRIDPVQIGNELLDYFKVNVMTIDMKQQEDDSEQSSFNHSSAPFIPDNIVPQYRSICPKVNHSFSSNMDNINYLLLHRRLKHASDSKIMTMCKKQTIKGLPLRFSSRLMRCGKDCWICSAAAIIDIPRGTIMSTVFLRLGELIHMDFYFMNVVSI